MTDDRRVGSHGIVRQLIKLLHANIIIIIIIRRRRRTRKTTTTTTTTLNWKAPGRDQIPNFWLKQLTATHRHIAAIFNKLIEEDQIPEWLTAGVTFLIPENENTENPKNYRPVTCLPTMYKLITSVISRRMQKYMDDENFIPERVLQRIKRMERSVANFKNNTAIM